VRTNFFYKHCIWWTS